MIIEIALGIVLGYIIIKSLPMLRDIAESIIEWLFNTITAILKIFYEGWKWLDNAAWYYKLGVFIFVSFLLLENNQVEYWGWFTLLYAYFPARWIYGLFHKQK